MRLIFNVSLNYLCGYFIANIAGRGTFHYMNHQCWRASERYFNGYVNMLFHGSHHIYLDIILCGNFMKYGLNVTRNSFIKYMFPVLRYPRKMILRIISFIYSFFYPQISKLDLFIQMTSIRFLTTNYQLSSLLANL